MVAVIVFLFCRETRKKQIDPPRSFTITLSPPPSHDPHSHSLTHSLTLSATTTMSYYTSPRNSLFPFRPDIHSAPPCAAPYPAHSLNSPQHSRGVQVSLITRSPCRIYFTLIVGLLLFYVTIYSPLHCIRSHSYSFWVLISVIRGKY